MVNFFNTRLSLVNTFSASLKKLKETEKVWENYKVQKSVIVKLLADAEVEIQKIVPKHNQKAIQSDLKTNKDIRDDIKRATDDLMTKMTELSETLATVASKDQQVIQEKYWPLIGQYRSHDINARL